MNSSTTASERNLASISPFFIVQDLQASISHYIERFGFTLDFQGPADDVYYGHVSRDGIGIMLKAIRPDARPCPNHTRHEWARWDAYIYTRDPDVLFDELKQRGASFVVVHHRLARDNSSLGDYRCQGSAVISSATQRPWSMPSNTAERK